MEWGSATESARLTARPAQKVVARRIDETRRVVDKAAGTGWVRWRVVLGLACGHEVAVDFRAKLAPSRYGNGQLTKKRARRMRDDAAWATCFACGAG
jgi:hypothetical protein